MLRRVSEGTSWTLETATGGKACFHLTLVETSEEYQEDITSLPSSCDN